MVTAGIVVPLVRRADSDRKTEFEMNMLLYHSVEFWIRCGVWYLAIGAGTLRPCVISNKRTNGGANQPAGHVVLGD